MFAMLLRTFETISILVALEETQKHFSFIKAQTE
jgi:hypothetical protein